MYHFIVNPNSRSGKGRLLWNKIYNELESKNVDYKIYFTEIENNGTKIAHEITKDSHECNIIAIGGDGTVNEVINGIKDFSKVTFSYIPTGSSNDFAKGLNLSNDYMEALDKLLNPKDFKEINIGMVSNKNEKRYFAVSCGIGFDADVCYEALNSTMKKLLNKLNLGKLTYFVIAIKRLFLSKMISMDVSFDNEQSIKYNKVFFIAAMNLPYEGGGLKLSPEAICDDDILDICLVNNLPKIKIFTLLPTAFKGKHTRFKGVNLKKCKNIDIKTSTPMAVHVDGEYFGYQNNVNISYDKHKLKVIV